MDELMNESDKFLVTITLTPEELKAVRRASGGFRIESFVYEAAIHRARQILGLESLTERREDHQSLRARARKEIPMLRQQSKAGIDRLREIS